MAHVLKTAGKARTWVDPPGRPRKDRGLKSHPARSVKGSRHRLVSSGRLKQKNWTYVTRMTFRVVYPLAPGNLKPTGMGNPRYTLSLPIPELSRDSRHVCARLE